MKALILKTCRAVAITAAVVSLVLSLMSGNWLGVSIELATLVAVV